MDKQCKLQDLKTYWNIQVCYCYSCSPCGRSRSFGTRPSLTMRSRISTPFSSLSGMKLMRGRRPGQRVSRLSSRRCLALRALCCICGPLVASLSINASGHKAFAFSWGKKSVTGYSTVLTCQSCHINTAYDQDGVMSELECKILLFWVVQLVCSHIEHIYPMQLHHFVAEKEASPLLNSKYLQDKETFL